MNFQREARLDCPHYLTITILILAMVLVAYGVSSDSGALPVKPDQLSGGRQPLAARYRDREASGMEIQEQEQGLANRSRQMENSSEKNFTSSGTNSDEFVNYSTATSSETRQKHAAVAAKLIPVLGETGTGKVVTVAPQSQATNPLYHENNLVDLESGKNDTKNLGLGPGESDLQIFGPRPGESNPQEFGPGPGEYEVQIFGPGPGED